MTHRVIQRGTGNVGVHSLRHLATALRVINAIPRARVCAHAPGLISTLDLPYTPSTYLARG